MKGSVEIYRCEGDKKTLVLKEDNLIVDGAGKTIVDALTVSPSLASIPSASSILDASNYTVKAITFGAASGSYTRDLHSTQYSQVVSALNNTTFVVLQTSTVPGYYPKTDVLPKAPSPIDNKLEPTCSPSGSWGPVTSISLPYTTSGGYLIEDFGHHLNVVGTSAIYNDFGVSAPIAVVIGSYCPKKGATDLSAYIISSISQISPTSQVSASVTSLVVTSTTNTYNGNDKIDRHGFIPLTNQVYTATPTFSPANGLVLSAILNPGVYYNGEIAYGTKIGSVDAQFLNLYGGVFHMGLWTLDLNRTLSAGNNPPYSFNNLNNPMKYRLFCKKSFTSNLVARTDLSTNQDLEIIWRIKFL